VVIVLSILAAFALDSWWAARVDQRALVQDLMGIRDEISRSLGGAEGGGLRERLERQMRVVVGSAALAERLGAVSDGERVTVPDSLLVMSVVAMTIDPRTAAVTSFISSGRLGEIEDTELRWMVAGWPSDIDDALEDERLSVTLVQDRIEPLLEAALAPEDYARVRGSMSDFFFGWDETSEAPVRASSELRNALLTRSSKAGLATREIRQLVDRGEELLRVLDAYLEAQR
jgi:hypothetical protein